MRLADELKGIETVEEIFALFGLGFDPRVLRVHRLHVIQRFGRDVAEIDRLAPPLDDDERTRRYAAALQRAHDYYQNESRSAEHAFSGVQRGLVKIRKARRD